MLKKSSSFDLASLKPRCTPRAFTRCGLGGRLWASCESS